MFFIIRTSLSCARLVLALIYLIFISLSLFISLIFIPIIFSDPALQRGLPLFQRLVDIAGGDSIVLVPESPLGKYSVGACFQKLAETNYVSFQGYLKCGHLGSRILLSPAPMVITSVGITERENIHEI